MLYDLHWRFRRHIEIKDLELYKRKPFELPRRLSWSVGSWAFLSFECIQVLFQRFQQRARRLRQIRNVSFVNADILFQLKKENLHIMKVEKLILNTEDEVVQILMR